MKRTAKAPKFQVVSTNFQHHAPIEAESFDAAATVAKDRGFEAQIYIGGHTLVAAWSPLYGFKFYGNYGQAFNPEDGTRVLVTIPSRAS